MLGLGPLSGSPLSSEAGLSVETVSPAAGHSGGQTLVEVTGSGFRLPAAPPTAGPAPVPPPSVRVLVGGAAASDVRVYSQNFLTFLTPKGDPDDARDVVVQNLDASGNVVEAYTLVGAFTFQRPDLTQESELARVVRALIRELARQIHPNVHFSTHSDYEDDSGLVDNMVNVGSVPALVLGNLEAPENREHHVDEGVEMDVENDRFIERRPPVTVDLNMTLVGVTDNAITILNLMQATRMFFKKNAWLVLDRVAGAPERGQVSYEMDWSFGGPVSVAHQGEGNIESFGGRVVIRGVLLEDMPGVSTDKPAGIPAHVPHEATLRHGWKTAPDASAVQVGAQRFAPENDED